MCRLGVVRALDMSSAAGLPSAEGLPQAMCAALPLGPPSAPSARDATHAAMTKTIKNRTLFVMKEGFAECWVFDDYEHDVRFVGRNFRALANNGR
jgi:hypothetical protein